jgi:hypothetical protein
MDLGNGANMNGAGNKKYDAGIAGQTFGVRLTSTGPKATSRAQSNDNIGLSSVVYMLRQQSSMKIISTRSPGGASPNCSGARPAEYRRETPIPDRPRLAVQCCFGNKATVSAQTPSVWHPIGTRHSWAEWSHLPTRVFHRQWPVVDGGHHRQFVGWSSTL